MRNDRSVRASHSHLVLALLAAAVAVAFPAPSPAEEAAHGVQILLPPSYDATQERSAANQYSGEPGPAEGVSDDAQTPPPIIVITAAPPPVPGWERSPEIEVVGLDAVGEVIVYSPAPEPMPGWRKLQGVDVRYHRIGEPRAPSRIPTHSWEPDAPTGIRYHDWRSADGAGIPYARTGGALVSQSWNPYGPRYEPSRIRYHGWTRDRDGR